MSDFLFQYHAVEPTTWAYLSSLLMIGLFFKFSRFLSVRNLDLILLISLAPGLLMVHYGQIAIAARMKKDVTEIDEDILSGGHSASSSGLSANASSQDSRPNAGQTPTESPNPSSRSETLSPKQDGPTTSPSSGPRESDEGSGFGLEIAGYVYLFAVGALLLTRLLLDSTMVRRPLLEPNLSVGGLAFIGCSLFIFLAGNVVAEPETAPTDGKDYRIARVAPASTQGPGYELLSFLPAAFSKSFCIAAQLGIVTGMVLIAYWHFRNISMGIGAATLYLMLPYTSLLTGRIEHVLPGALLVWAILLYRRPLLSGALLGLASGVVYYPFFLLPLWLSFYWHRGFSRFLTSYLVILLVLACVLILSPKQLSDDLQRMFGLQAPAMRDLGGIWNEDHGGMNGSYRIPVLVGFVALSISMALWPAQKNLGTLLSCTGAVMVAAQFWHGYGGGTFMAWYLPLTLLTIFRPNLEDRVAASVLAEGWFSKRKANAVIAT